MGKATEETISYYDNHAKAFVADTAEAPMGRLQALFASLLPAGGRILDLGCGSGRDSLAFLRVGFRVDAMDGSGAMCDAARELTGLPVAHATFEGYEPQGPYDGIWACSSLLHVPRGELPGLIDKYAAVLAPRGVFYLSFKLGEGEGMRSGRWFTDLDELGLRTVISEAKGLAIKKIEITPDVRPSRTHELWLNAWCTSTSIVRNRS